MKLMLVRDDGTLDLVMSNIENYDFTPAGNLDLVEAITKAVDRAYPMTLDEAGDIVMEEWGTDPEDIRFDCNNGHYECSYRSGGACMNEAIARVFGEARAAGRPDA